MSNIDILYQSLIKRPQFKDLSIDKFKKDMQDDDNRKALFGSLSKIPDFPQVDYETFTRDMGYGYFDGGFPNIYEAKQEQPKWEENKPTIPMRDNVAMMPSLQKQQSETPLDDQQVKNVMYGDVPSGTKIGDVQINRAGTDFLMNKNYGKKPEKQPEKNVNIQTPALGEEMSIGKFSPIYAEEEQAPEVREYGFIPKIVQSFNAGASGAISSLASYAEEISREGKNMFDIPIVRDVLPTKWLFGKEEEFFKGVKEYFKNDANKSRVIAEIEGGKDFTQLWKEGKYMDAAQEVYLKATESLPLSLAVIATTIAGKPNVGMGLMYASSAGGQMDQLSSRTDMTDTQKQINAHVTGLIEALSEKLGDIPIANWLKRIYSTGGKTAVNQASKNIFRNVADKAFSTNGLLFPIVSEGIEESAGQFGQNAVSYVTGETDKLDLMKDVGKSFVYGSAGGSQFAAAGAPGLIKNTIAKKNITKKAQQASDNVDNLFDGYDTQALKGALKGKTEDEKIEVLNSIATGEFTDEQKDAIFDYYSATQRYEALKGGELKAKINNSNEQGKEIFLKSQGRPFSGTLYNVYNKINQYEAGLGEYISSLSNDEIMDSLNNGSYDEDIDMVLRNYVSTRSMFDGAVSAMREQADTEIAQIHSEIDATTRKDGTRLIVQTEEYNKQPGQTFYVTDGNIALDRHGNVIRNQSDTTLTVTNEAGETQILPINAVATASYQNAQDAKDKIAADITARYEDMLAKELDTDPVEVKKQEGAEITWYENGQPRQGIVIDKTNGYVRIQEGNKVILKNEQELNEQLKNPTELYHINDTMQLYFDGVAYDAEITSEKDPDGRYTVNIPNHPEMINHDLTAEEITSLQTAPVAEETSAPPTTETEPVEELTPEQQAEKETEAFLASLPKIKTGNKAGRVDTKKLTPEQAFQYTKVTEDAETAIKDLKADIFSIDTNIRALEKKLQTTTGTAKIDIREDVKELKERRDNLKTILDREAPGLEAEMKAQAEKKAKIEAEVKAKNEAIAEARKNRVLTEEEKNNMHNSMVQLIREYNGLPANYTQKKRNIFAEISKKASQLGYSATLLRGGQLNVVDKEGKPIRTIAQRTSKEEINEHQLLTEYAPEFQEFALKLMQSMPETLDFPNTNVEKAVKDITAGIKSVAANRMLDRMEDMYSSNEIVIRATALSPELMLDIPSYFALFEPETDNGIHSLNEMLQYAPEEFYFEIYDDLITDDNIDYINQLFEQYGYEQQQERETRTYPGDEGTSSQEAIGGNAEEGISEEQEPGEEVKAKVKNETPSLTEEQSAMTKEARKSPTSVRELADMDAEDNKGYLSAGVLTTVEQGQSFKVGSNRTYTVTKKTKPNKVQYENEKFKGEYTRTSVTIKDDKGKTYSFEMWDDWTQNGKRMVSTILRKGSSRSGDPVAGLSRDIEGDITIDLINEYNQFYDKSDSYKILNKYILDVNRKLGTSPIQPTPETPSKQSVETLTPKVDTSTPKVDTSAKQPSLSREPKEVLQERKRLATEEKNRLTKLLSGKAIDMFREQSENELEAGTFDPTQTNNRIAELSTIEKELDAQIKLAEQAEKKGVEEAQGQQEVSFEEEQPVEPKSIEDMAKEAVKKNEQSKVSQAQQEADEALKDFLDAFNDLNSDNLGIVDNTAEKQAKMLVAGTKMVGAFTKLGIYKFADVVKSIASKGIQITEDLLSAIKKAYGAFSAENDIDALDDMKTVRKFTLNDLTENKNEDLTPKENNSKKNNVSLNDQKLTKEHVIFGTIQKTNDNGNSKQRVLQGSNKRLSGTAQPDLFSGVDSGEGTGGSVGTQNNAVSGADATEQQPTGRTGSVLSGNVDVLTPALVPFNAEDNDTQSFNQSRKYDDNIAAIETLITLVKENRKATPDEKAILSNYVGFGGLKDIVLNPESAEGWKESNLKYRAQVKRIVELAAEFDQVTGSSDSLAKIKGSILNAHFTSSSVIRSVYDGIQKLGFKGGRMLEPSAGIGNFITYAPERIKANSNITAVELDNLTGNILKYLHDDVNVKVTGIQDAQIPNNSQDLVISNVPFGNYKIFDKALKGDKAEFQNRIHNYFFAKAIDMAREGGIIAFVTSKGVMDAAGNESLRKYLNDNAEFLGAVRLPNNAFKNNANTEVVTDIIFLKKNTTGAKNNPDFVSIKQVEATHKDGEKQMVNVNNYFVENPQNMLGNIVAGGLYSREDYTVENKTGYDLSKAIKNALPAGVYEKVNSKIGLQANDSQQTIDAIKEGNIEVTGGRVVRKEEGQLIDIRINEPQGKIEHYIRLRNALMNLIYSEYLGKPDSELNAIRQQLNTEYDTFVKKHGKLSKNAIKIAKQDADGFNVLSLEVADKKDGKADIFRQRTIQPIQNKLTAESVDEAIVISLYENASIDVERIAELLNKTVPEVLQQAKGKIFEQPEGGFVTREEYLSGNVKAKLRQAQEAVDKGFSEFAYNVEQLMDVIPADIPAMHIEARLGSRWIPQEVYTEFAQHLFNTPSAKVIYQRSIDAYSNNGRIETVEAHSKWGTARRNGSDILLDALHINPPKIFDTIKEFGQEKRVLNQDETKKAVEKYEEIRAEFENWVYKAEERRTLLARIYNEKYNTTVKRSYNGDHLNIAGINGVELRPHQKDAVWMLLQNNGGIIDHLVGAGKTLVMVAGTMEMKRTGIAKKPMIIALKSTIPQIVETYRKAYPMAKILAPLEKDFTKDNRRKLFSQIANNEWDVIIMSHENYGKIPHEADIQRDFLRAEMQEIEDERGELEAAGEKQALKGLEIRLKNLEARLEKISDIDKDNSLTFEQMGIDHIMVDESQQFKNLSYVTKQRGVAGLSKAEGSKRAFNLFIGVRYLQQKYGEDKGTTFLSGTPISNSMVEMYLLLKYLRPGKMAELGFNSFDAWATTFASPSSDIEFTVTGDFKSKTRFREFINVPELSMLYTEIADIRTDANTPLDKPKMKGGGYTVVDIKMSEDQKEYGQRLMEFARTKDGHHIGMTLTKNQETAAMLLATNLSSKMAIDMRLIDSSYDYDPNGKIAKLVDNVERIYNETVEHKGTQLIFSDLGTPKNKTNKTAGLRDYMEDEMGVNLDTLNEIFGNPDEAGYKYPSINSIREKLSSILELTDAEIDNIISESEQSEGAFNVYGEVRKRLVEKGIPEEQVVFIHDYNSQRAKEKLFKQVQNGEIRIVLGSTQKLGTGVNVQDRVVAVHHLDVPWTPASMEQRNGRAIRQGNWVAKNHYGNELPIYAYATERTLDAYKYQLLQTKQRFLDQVKSGDVEERTVRESDGDSESGVGYAELVAILSGNTDILLKAKLETLVQKLTKSKRNYLSEIYEAQDKKQKLTDRIPVIESNIAKTTENIEIITNAVQYAEDGKMIVADINGETLIVKNDKGKVVPTERVDYGKRAVEIAKAKLNGASYENIVKLFSLNGFDFYGSKRNEIAMNNGMSGHVEKRYITLRAKNGVEYNVTYSETPGVLLNNIQKAIQGIPAILSTQQSILDKANKDIIAYNEIISKGTEWEKETELTKALNELKEVNKRLDDISTKDQPKTASESDAVADDKIRIGGFDGENANILRDNQLKYTVSQTGFYSTVEKALNSINQGKGTKAQFKQMLLKNGAKQAEMDWMGFDELPDKLTKADIQNWIDENRIEVEEVEKGKSAEPISYEEYDDYPNTYIVTFNNGEQVDVDFSGSSDFDVRRRGDKKAIFEEAKNQYDVAEDETKFSQYTLPGGENYKELLLTMPQKPISKPYEQWLKENFYGEDRQEAMEVYKQQIEPNEPYFLSSHFNEPNILAHIRFNEREVNGERVLFIEEIQSDWAQTGKKEGFKSDNRKAITESLRKEKDNFYTKLNESEDKQVEYGLSQFESGKINREQLDKILLANGYSEYDLKSAAEKNSVPDMPFKKTDQWVNLAMRRMMRYAAENGFDRIAWTPGSVQVDRYDLSKKIEKVEYWKVEREDLKEPRYGVYVYGKQGDRLYSTNKSLATPSELEDIIGKELTQKIVDKATTDVNEFTGLDLKVGGEGMKAFYDAIVPSAMSKLGKPFGAKVENIGINTNHLKQGGNSTDWNNVKAEINKDYEGNYFIALVGNNVYWNLREGLTPDETTFNDGGSSIKTFESKKEAEKYAEKYIQEQKDKLNIETVQSIPVTDSMKETALEGMPLFESTQTFINFTPEEQKDEIDKAYGSEEKQQEAIKKAITEAEKIQLPGTIGGRTDAGRANELSPVHSLRTVLTGFKESGYVNFNGTKVSSHQDIADLWSIHRSPYIEKSHVVFIKDGKIAGSMAMSSGKIAVTYFPEVEKITNHANKLGATQVYFLHNHPSGNPTPSGMDVKLTYHHADKLLTEGIDVLGHVIVDHDKYAFIDTQKTWPENLDYNTVERVAKEVELFDYKESKQQLYEDRDYLGNSQTVRDNLFMLGRDLLSEPTYKAAIVYMSSNKDVGFSLSAYDILPNSASTADIARMVAEGLNKNLGQQAVIIHNGQVGTFKSRLHQGVVDVINLKSKHSDNFLNETTEPIDKDTLWAKQFVGEYGAKNLDKAEEKQKQFDIVSRENPMLDDYHTGIRSIDDIKTFEEAYKNDVNTDNFITSPDFTQKDVEKAIENGEVTIYSSYPIKNGVFVTPSKMEAQSYSGNGKVYSKKIKLSEVAWISNHEGQYANISEAEEATTRLDNLKVAKEMEAFLSDKEDIIGGVYNSPEYKTADKVRQHLKLRGIDKSFTISDTNFGKSMYFTVYGENQNEPKLKVRISDHGVTNIDRIFGEQHESAMSDPIRIANDIELAMFPERYNKIQSGNIYYSAYDNRYISESEISKDGKYHNRVTIEDSEASFKNTHEGKVRIISKEPIRVSKRGNTIYKYTFERVEPVKSEPRYKYERKEKAPELKKFTPLEIRQATGWEKGSDGLWRYETAKHTIHPQLQEYMDKSSDGFIKWNNARLNHGLPVNLQDIYGRKDETLKSLPQLRTIPVKIVPDAEMGGSMGGYNPETKTILINSKIINDQDKVLSVLEHEVQHAIQHIEGFAKGGNPTIFKDAKNKDNIGLFGIFDKIKEVKPKTVEELKLLKKNILGDNPYMYETDDFNKVIRKLENGDISIEQIIKTPYERYLNLAGEVEARNAQTRMNYTDEQRRNTLLSETANVAPEDQIIIMDGLGVSMSMTEDEVQAKADKIINEGLKSVIPDYVDFLKNVYDAVPDSARRFIIDRSKDYGWDIGRATEEYLASFVKGVSPAELDKIAELAGLQDLAPSEIKMAFWDNFNPKDDSPEYMAKRSLAVYNSRDGVLPEKPTIKQVQEAYERIVTPKRKYNKSNLLKKETGKHAAFRVEESYANSLASLRVFMDIIGEVPDKYNPYYLMQLYTSAASTTMDRYEKKEFKDMMTALTQLNKELKQAEGLNYLSRDYKGEKGEINRGTLYALAKAGLDRNERLARKNAADQLQPEYNKLNKQLLKGEIDQEAYEDMLSILSDKENELAEDINAKHDFGGLTGLAKLVGSDAENFEDIRGVVEDIVAEAEGAVNTDDFWAKTKAATSYVLTYQYNRGMMSKELYEEILEMEPHYLPLRGYDEATAGDVYEYFTSFKGEFNPVLKKAKGHEHLPENPFAHIKSMTASGVLQAEKNRAKQALLNLVENNKNDLVTAGKSWIRNIGTEEMPEWEDAYPVIPEDATPEQVTEAINDFENKMKELAAEGKAAIKSKKLKLNLPIGKGVPEEHTIKVRRNGEERTLYVNGNPRLAQAINGMLNPDATDTAAVLKVVKAINRGMSANFTSRNLEFAITNTLRDLHMAIALSGIEEGIGYSANLAKNAVVAQRTLASHIFGSGKKGKYQDYLQEFLENGGQTGFVNLRSVERYHKDIKKLERELRKKDPFAIPKWIFGQIEDVNQMGELISRFATYITSREAGRSVTRSSVDAKNITLNFNQKGTGELGASWFQNLILFFNPAMQALYRANQARQKHPARFWGVMGAHAAAGAMVPMLTFIIAGMMGDDDDKKEMEDAYWNTSTWIRRNNLMLWIPGTKSFITIPLGQELRWAYSIGEIAFTKAMGKDAYGKNVGTEMVGAVTALLPVDMFGASHWYMPGFATPIYESTVNENFMGNPIYKSTPWNENDPSHTKAYSRTWKGFVGVSRKINELTGGDDVTKGKVDINPAVAQHLVEGYLGGLVSVYLRGADVAAAAMKGEEYTVNEVPFLRRVYKVSDKTMVDSSVKREYFNILNDLEKDYGHKELRWRQKNKEFETKYNNAIKDLQEQGVELTPETTAGILTPEELKDWQEYQEKYNDLIQSTDAQKMQVFKEAKKVRNKWEKDGEEFSDTYLMQQVLERVKAIDEAEETNY